MTEHHEQDTGIIPAGAGNSLCVPGNVRLLRDLPRRRGELGATGDAGAVREGSSPQARGTRQSA